MAAMTSAAPASDDLPGRMSPRDTAALTRRITWMSLTVAAVLVLAKAAAWLMTDSVALLASMADSALDLLASAGAFFAVRYAVVPPDAEHRYGHGKAEAFASLMQAGLVFASAALVGQEALHHLLQPSTVQGGAVGVGVMILSLVQTFALVTAQGRVLKRTQSVAVSGDRAHYLMDFAANGAALVGVALKLIVPQRFGRMALVLYLAIGWSGVLVFQTLATVLPPVSFWLLVAGGITYSAGIIFHVWERLKFQNVLWHIFVVAGSICHLWAIFDCMVLSRL